MMTGRGWDVHVIMTRGATEFVGKLTFQTLSRNPVGVELFDGDVEWRPEHIALADRADVLVVAPCTANVLAKIAHGLADDLLSCTILACTAPLVIAPAMNVHMWDHPATQANVATVIGRGAHLVDVGVGELACGYSGKGRLADVEAIVESVEKVLQAGEAKA